MMRRDAPRIAYLANRFPSPVEPYVADEIRELRARGVEVVACSLRRNHEALENDLQTLAAETLCLQPLRPWLLARAAWLGLRKASALSALFRRIFAGGREGPGRRLRALLHTWLGACYALRIEGCGVEHIHAHHGYCASWVAMVAARLTGASFSMTLHGSDLLLHAAYLDIKLKDCRFCITVSEFNRRHILEHYSSAEESKVVVRRLGVAVEPGHPRSETASLEAHPEAGGRLLILLAVGRLHPVKDHAFLVRACAELRNRGSRFLCLIAGEGPERSSLEKMIHKLDLQSQVRLMGHVSRQKLAGYYRMCDLVVLTSRSEGLPLVLMEAMAFGSLVLAPAITGIPELVEDGRTGFLYRAGSLAEFVAQVEMIRKIQPALGPLRLKARRHVLENFNREKNLAALADLFLEQLGHPPERLIYEDPILQQV